MTRKLFPWCDAASFCHQISQEESRNGPSSPNHTGQRMTDCA